MKLFNTILWSITNLFIFTGFVFKFMHWPGASFLLVLGFPLSWISMLTYFIIRFRNKEEAKVGTYAVCFYFIVLGLGITMYGGMNASRSLLNSFVEVQLATDKNSLLIESLIQQAKFEKFKEIKEKTALLVQQIREDKKNLIEQTGGVDENNYPLGKDDQDIGMIYFTVLNAGERGVRLSQSINVLRMDYQEILGENHPALFSWAHSEDFGLNGNEPSWIVQNFEHLPLSACLAKLSAIENEILNCELVTLEKLSSSDVSTINTDSIQ